MRPLLTALAAGCCLLAVLDVHSGPYAATGGSLAEVDSVTVRTRHRVFLDFQDIQTVSPADTFYVGDTEFSARIIDFVPDFAIKADGEVVSRSDRPDNPAFLLEVLQDDAPVDTTWAFWASRSAPHFRRDAMLAFQILSFRYRGEMVTDPGARDIDKEGDAE